MLVRTDPYRELDRLTQQAFGTPTRPAVMPMDAWRDRDEFVVAFDLPGVEPGLLDIDVEGDVLTVKAERHPPTTGEFEMVAAERPNGVFSHQLIVADTLDTEHIHASYNVGVLTLRIPIAERAKPRKISISVASPDPRVVEAE